MTDAPEEEQHAQEEERQIDRAFGAENRNRLIESYFNSQSENDTSPARAWEHVYRLLLWSDPTTGLAHCYESDKCQPGKPWYSRSLAFHDWLCAALGTSPVALAQNIDWLFINACADLTAEVLRRASARAAVAERQRRPYEGRGFPKAGEDPELVSLVKGVLGEHLSTDPSSETWQILVQQVRQYLALQNKRKNLVGEGFEDVLTQVVRRSCNVPSNEIFTRRLLYEIPGFNRARVGGKENKVDLAIIRPSLRTLVTAKWSVRADREKQFPAEYAEYNAAESSGKLFEYVFVTNEFDPARLMRACENLHQNAFMFRHVVHINTDAVKAAYGNSRQESMRKVLQFIDNGRLISLERWLNHLAG
jgi:hypothetical protein